MKLNDLVSLVSLKVAPLSLAESWDKVGLQIGDLEHNVKKALVCLDITPNVLKEAVLKKVDVVFSHHPLFFHPLHNLNKNDPKYEVLKLALQKNISLVSLHTNLDKTFESLSDDIAKRIGLHNIKPLILEKDHYSKFVVFVPLSHVEKVRNALFSVGGGVIGNYENCSFNIEGTGTFKGGEESKPYIGHKRTLEKTQEVRIEVRIPCYLEKEVLSQVRKAHPYEEVAYDIYPLRKLSETTGIGRIGDLKKKVSFLDFAKDIKKLWRLKSLRVVKSKSSVERVALCPGSGGSLWKEALASQADVYITGDLKYHEALDGSLWGLNFIEIDHFTFEKEYVSYLAQKLKQISKIQVYEYNQAENPFQVIN
ncbi:MAG: Nif3-like dinuclear metal center hexameric protein [Deltaproteobacteria bacterium]|nr:Nif3-like dinuclear metal center hexameric protein [Deltaproteobacteria bacterium]